jgi:hypothetical protein
LQHRQAILVLLGKDLVSSAIFDPQHPSAGKAGAVENSAMADIKTDVNGRSGSKLLTIRGGR